MGNVHSIDTIKRIYRRCTQDQPERGDKKKEKGGIVVSLFVFFTKKIYIGCPYGFSGLN